MERKRKNAAHLRNLILLALRDNNFDDREMKLIVKIATRMELSCCEFEEIIQKEDLKLEIPETIYERIEHLNDLVSVMKVDNEIHEEETKFLTQFAKYYGFLITNDESIDLDLNFNNVRNHKSFKKFISVFKKMTGENLSEIRVDDDFRVLFPLYKKELSVGPMAKTLYIFFLKKHEGCMIADLQNNENKELLKYIYRNIPNANKNVNERVDNLTHPLGSSFFENTARINRILKSILPCENLEPYYKIAGSKNEPRKINLKQDLISIQPSI